MEFLTEIIRYLMDKAGPLAVVMMMVLWWGYKLLIRKEDVIDGLGDTILGLKDQMASNRETQIKLITLLENLIYGKSRHE